MKHNFLVFCLIVTLLAACATPTPQTPPQLINVYVTSAAYPWVSGFYNCASSFAVINLSDPLSADITLRLGEPGSLTTPAFQISKEDILVIANPQTGAGALNLNQVRSLFLGQSLNWNEVGGNDVPVQVWAFSPEEDVQEIFSKAVMDGQTVTSLARLAPTAQDMLKSVRSGTGSIGLLPRHLLAPDVKEIFSVAAVPVLAITKTAPQGAVKELIGCLQENH